MTYLIDSDLAIFTFCIIVLRFRRVFVLGKMHRGATSAHSVIEEHAVPLLDVRMESDSL